MTTTQEPTGSRRARVARGLGMAGSSVVVAALSHVAAGGAAPGALGTGLALAFAVLVCIALAGRSLSLPRTVVAVAASQGVFHVLFSLGAALPSAHGHDVSMLGMVMSGGNTAALPSLTTSGDAAAFEVEGATMWAGHAVAALATIALLLHGERGVAALVRVATDRLRVVVDPASVVPHPVPVSRHRVALAVADRRGLRDPGRLLAARPHRGPPLAA